MSLPDTLQFEGVYKPGKYLPTPCYYLSLGFREPRKGEWYVSGAIPMAYRAPNDLPTRYLVVEPTHFEHKQTVITKGDRVQVRRIA